MKHLFDFGISQEDAMSEKKALDLQNGDHLLSITSGGDVALNLLASANVFVKCVDVSENQNSLLRIKMAAALVLEPVEVAEFLGFMHLDAQRRKFLYSKVRTQLPKKDQEFWRQNNWAIECGVVHAARFEQYISKYNSIALAIIGRKKLMGLLEKETIEEQYVYFDQTIKTRLLKSLFKIAFHPKLYKGNGLADQAFTNYGAYSIADFFFNRFRDFCCSTIARKNYYLQFTFFNKVLLAEALPEFLTEKGAANLKEYHENLDIETRSIFEALKDIPEKVFNKFHISNISDWTTKEEFSNLLRLVYNKSAVDGKICWRFIQCRHNLPADLLGKMQANTALGNAIVKADRYPFYNIIPMHIIKT